MFENLKELKDKVSVSDVVGHFIQLKKEGSSLKACCPFHSEKSPSFYIHKQQNRWKCFGCGLSGDSIEFVMKHQSVSFPDSVRMIASIVNFKLEEESRTVVKPAQRLTKLSKDFLDNFEKVRMISNNTLLRFNVTESVEWMPKANKEIKVICFNYYKNNELVNIKFRGKNKDMRLSKDGELVFYNLDAIKDEESCVIVEGEIDCLSCHEAGVYNAVSVPNGANANFRYIDNSYDFFINKNKIVIAVDSDDAGKKLKDELLSRFGREKCYIAHFPPDCKDANDVLVKHGVETLRTCIEQARQLNVEGVVPKNERKEALFNLYKNGVPRGTPAGIHGLDEYIRFQGGLVTGITGAPGSGKSEFLDYIMANLAINEGWRFGVFSLENQPTHLHDQKIAEKIVGKAFAFRKDKSHRIDEKELDLVFDTLDDRFKTIDKTQSDMSLDGILKKAEELLGRYGIKGLVIDPYNKILHKTPNMYDPSYVNEFMNRLDNFSVATNIHTFLVAHPSKLLKDKSTGKIEVPTLYSISGGANFYNQLGNGVIINRDRQTGLVEAIIAKIRFNEQGKEGWVSFTFNTMTRQYQYASSSDPITKHEYKKEFIDNITSDNDLDYIIPF